MCNNREKNLGKMKKTLISSSVNWGQLNSKWPPDVLH